MPYDIDNVFTYHPLIADQAERYQHLRSKAKELARDILQLTPYSREQALALTNLEQAIFWANASIARNETAAAENATDGGNKSSPENTSAPRLSMDAKWEAIMSNFKELCKALLDEIPYESPTTCLVREALLSDSGINMPTAKELKALWEACSSPGVFARAVLKGWGNPRTKPVPVSEKPWERPGWCDNQGRCWAWSRTRKCWHLMDPGIAIDWIKLLPFDAIPSFDENSEIGSER